MTHRHKKEEGDVKAALKDLTKIPAKDFELHFREWMERDDVARELQAKLRADLIINFNKTSLGKQILCHTSNVGSKHLLTLSPLILGLNTLVAEFLYAQNCHFTLSVFCTEVPYRNILPDFESMRVFRFNEAEILDIVAAISSTTRGQKILVERLPQMYKNEEHMSLLLLILKSLVENVNEEPTMPSFLPDVYSSSQTLYNPEDHEKEMRRNLKAEIYSKNFRLFNKFLVTLTKKVKDMLQQFDIFIEQLQQQRHMAKMSKLSNFSEFNINLEQIIEDLYDINHANTKSKYVDGLVTAIGELGVQFTKCAKSFDNIVKAIILSEELERERELLRAKQQEAQAAKVVEKPAKTAVEQKCAGVQTEEHIVPEKSYIEWVHEMRNTLNGQKFLERIEISLKKALQKQKAELCHETEIKLRHQKELLKIKYNQKLLDHTCHQHASQETSADNIKLSEEFANQIKKFEDKHMEMLKNLREQSLETKDMLYKEVREFQAMENKRREADLLCAAQAKPQLPIVKPTELSEQQLAAVEQNRQPKPQTIPRSTVGTTQQWDSVAQQQQTDGPKTVTSIIGMENVANLLSLQQQQQTIPLKSHTLQHKLLKKENSAEKRIVHTKKVLQDIIKEATERERSVDHIVFDTKMRVQELENESNQLEKNFGEYLDRQRQQKRAESNAVSELWNNYAAEREKLHIKWEELAARKVKHKSKKSKKSKTHAEHIENLKSKIVSGETEIANQLTNSADKSTSDDSLHKDTHSLNFKNAILEAKQKFFEQDRLFREKSEKAYALPALSLGETLLSNEAQADEKAALEITQMLPAYHSTLLTEQENLTKSLNFSRLLRHSINRGKTFIKDQKLNNVLNANSSTDIATSTSLTATNSSSSISVVTSTLASTSASKQSCSTSSSSLEMTKGLNKSKRCLFPAKIKTTTNTKTTKSTKTKATTATTATSIATTATAVAQQNETQIHNISKNGANLTEVVQVHLTNIENSNKENLQQIQDVRLMQKRSNSNKRNQLPAADRVGKNVNENIVGKKSTNALTNNKKAGTTATPTETIPIESTVTSLMLQQSMEKMQQLFSQSTLRNENENENECEMSAATLEDEYEVADLQNENESSAASSAPHAVSNIGTNTKHVAQKNVQSTAVDLQMPKMITVDEIEAAAKQGNLREAHKIFKAYRAQDLTYAAHSAISKATTTNTSNALQQEVVEVSKFTSADVRALAELPEIGEAIDESLHEASESSSSKFWR